MRMRIGVTMRMNRKDGKKIPTVVERDP